MPGVYSKDGKASTSSLSDNDDGDKNVSQATSSLDSDSDDDLYSNYINKAKVKPVFATVSSSASSKKGQSTSGASRAKKARIDSDDENDITIEELTFEQRLKALEAESQKQDKAMLDEAEAEVERISRQAEVIREEPMNYYCMPVFNEASENLKACRAVTGVAETTKDNADGDNHDSSVLSQDLDAVELLVIDRFINVIAADGEMLRWGHRATLQDLYTTTAQKWSCTTKEVRIQVGETDKEAEPEDTPESLGLEPFSVTKMFLFRRKLRCKTGGVEEEYKDPNIINIKCLQADAKPKMVKVDKRLTFGDLRATIAEQCGFSGSLTIERMMFDNEEIADDQTPESLDIEDDDCIDVHVGGGGKRPGRACKSSSQEKQSSTNNTKSRTNNKSK